MVEQVKKIYGVEWDKMDVWAKVSAVSDYSRRIKPAVGIASDTRETFERSIKREVNRILDLVA